MYRVGFIDDQDKHVSKYQRRFKKLGIDLIYLEHALDYNGIVDWIFSEKIDAILIDYRLTPRYDFIGSRLVNYLNKKIFDFPCMLLTSYATDALNEELISESFILKKSDMQEGIEKISKKIIQNIKVFQKRLSLAEEEYREDFMKYKNNELDIQKIEELKEKYNVLKGYHLIEEYDWSAIDKEKDEELNEAVKKLDKILKKFKEIEVE